LYPISDPEYHEFNVPIVGSDSDDESFHRIAIFQLDTVILEAIVEAECSPVIILGYGGKEVPLGSLETARRLLFVHGVQAVISFTAQENGSNYNLAIFRFSIGGFSLVENHVSVTDTQIFDLLINCARLIERTLH
jgi:hypothetical protein